MKTVKLGDICAPKQWPVISKAQMLPTGFPVYGANGKIGFTDSFTHENPTILIGCRGSCGTVHVTEPRSYANGNAMALDALEESTVSVDYLRQFLSARGFADVITGTSQPQIIRQKIVTVEIPLPALEEQRRIADILDAADALRAKRRLALARLDDLALALFLHHFGDPVSNPKAWPVKKVQTFCDLVRGSSPRPQGDPRYFGGPVPRLMVADVTRDGRLVTPQIDSLTDEGAKRSRPVPAGTIVMAVSGDVGLVSILAVDACIHDGFAGFTNLNHTLFAPIFLLATLHYLKPTHANRKAGAVFQNITTTDIKDMDIPAPPLDLQRRFAAEIAVVESLKAQHRAGLARLDALFASLQDRAFSGKL